MAVPMPPSIASIRLSTLFSIRVNLPASVLSVSLSAPLVASLAPMKIRTLSLNVLYSFQSSSWWHLWLPFW